MLLASAYPDSAISTVAMMAIAFVAVGTLAFWLGMMFIADRQPRKQDQKQARGYTTVVAAPGKTTKDIHSESDHQHGVAA